MSLIFGFIKVSCEDKNMDVDGGKENLIVDFPSKKFLIFEPNVAFVN